MTKIKWINFCHIIIVYYITIFIIAINGKSILFGERIIELNGNIKIPVFVPTSWLIHDIHSAKLIGQKSEEKDMMTSDMTPDLNGNFERHESDEKQIKTVLNHKITNRVSNPHKPHNSHIITQTPKIQDLNAKVKNPKEKNPKGTPHQKLMEPSLESDEMGLSLESNLQKIIAKQRFKDEIMYEPDVWPKEVDPMLTTIEIYEVPGPNSLMGLESNRTTVHKSPEEKKTDKTDDKIKIRLKPNMIKDVRSKISQANKPKVTESKVKVLKHSNNNNYFKNYLKQNMN